MFKVLLTSSVLTHGGQQLTNYEIRISEYDPETQRETCLSNLPARRRYSDFVWLQDFLKICYPNKKPPKLPPGAMVTEDRLSFAFLASRKARLKFFLQQLTRDPEYMGNKAVQSFLQTNKTAESIIDGYLEADQETKRLLDNSKKRVKCLKYFTCALNILLWLSGMGLLALALYRRIAPADATGEAWYRDSEVLFVVDYIMMAAGGLLTLGGFVGCWGAVQESRCILRFFAVLVFVVIAIQLAGGVITVIYKAGSYFVHSVAQFFSVMWIAVAFGLSALQFFLLALSFGLSQLMLRYTRIISVLSTSSSTWSLQ